MLFLSSFLFSLMSGRCVNAPTLRYSLSSSSPLFALFDDNGNTSEGEANPFKCSAAAAAFLFETTPYSVIVSLTACLLLSEFSDLIFGKNSLNFSWSCLTSTSY